MIGMAQTAKRWARALTAAALLAGTAVPYGAIGADIAILQNGAPVDGNVVLIGDMKQWDTFVGSAPISSASGFLAVNPDNAEGALEAAWNGEGEAQFFIAHEAPRDYSAHLEQDAGLALVIRVDARPEKKATMKLGCGYPCASDADITRLLDALPEGQWVRVSFDLKCFADGGLNIRNVDTPLLITTKGSMSLSFSDLSIVPGLGPQATIRCR